MMNSKYILAAVLILFSNAALVETVMDKEPVLKMLPASPHQLLVLENLAPVVQEMHHRSPKPDGKRKMGEFARFEAMEISETGKDWSTNVYQMSLSQREIIGLSTRKIGKEQ